MSASPELLTRRRYLVDLIGDPAAKVSPSPSIDAPRGGFVVRCHVCADPDARGPYRARPRVVVAKSAYVGACRRIWAEHAATEAHRRNLAIAREKEVNR